MESAFNRPVFNSEEELRAAQVFSQPQLAMLRGMYIAKLEQLQGITLSASNIVESQYDIIALQSELNFINELISNHTAAIQSET